MADEVFDPVVPEEKKPNTTLIIVIVVVVLLLCCICACVIVFGLPTLLGPSIGDVFSEIVTDLETIP